MHNPGFQSPIFQSRFWIRILWILALPFLVSACLPKGMSLEENPLLRTLERKSGLIAYVGLDGNIYTIDQGGGRQQAITSDARVLPDQGENPRFYQFPSWSRSGRRLAFVGIDGSDEGIEAAALYTVNADGQDLVEAFRSDTRFPFYLYWSPDGKIVSFLTTDSTDSSISLQVVPQRGGEARLLDTGSPYYWHWSPDNRTVMVHTGGAAAVRPEARLALLGVTGDIPEKELELSPAFFQAPGWSPRGDAFLLVAESEEGKDELVLADSQGVVKKVIAAVQGPVAFGWSPDGKRLAYIGSKEGEVTANNILTVFKTDNLDSAETTLDENVIAFFWSPDSRKIAYFTPRVIEPDAQEGEQAQPVTLVKLGMLDVGNGKSHEVTNFLPTQFFVQVLSFFDQYQYSASVWSPDSKNLVISAHNGDGTPTIFIVEASGNLQPRFIAAGHLGFWSWK